MAILEDLLQMHDPRTGRFDWVGQAQDPPGAKFNQLFRAVVTSAQLA